MAKHPQQTKLAVSSDALVLALEKEVRRSRVPERMRERCTGLAREILQEPQRAHELVVALCAYWRLL